MGKTVAAEKSRTLPRAQGAAEGKSNSYPVGANNSGTAGCARDTDRPVCASEALFKLDEALKGLEELAERRCGEHDRIAPTADVFGDLKKPSALVFLEV